MLFPGGEGRLVLTDPDDLLATGIEVEARPPGKKVKRLSLLSGGERSLTAVALLWRSSGPGPRRSTCSTRSRRRWTTATSAGCSTSVEELRATLQLIIITHQKRTMEIADALYGVTHARRRHHRRDQPAAARARARLTLRHRRPADDQAQVVP